MICPDGYFTPNALTADFARVLKNDRIAPQIFASANCNFDDIASRDRGQIYEVCAKLFAQCFVNENENNTRLFRYPLEKPLHTDPWIWKYSEALPLGLPKNLEAADRLSRVLVDRHRYVDTTLWVIDRRKVSGRENIPTRLENDLLNYLDGFSICFTADLWPNDIGKALDEIALRIAQRVRSTKGKDKRPGRKPKVTPLAQSLRQLYPTGLPGKPAKAFRRDLEAAGEHEFSDTTLYAAIAKAKNL